MTRTAFPVTCFAGTHREEGCSQPGLPLAITIVWEWLVDVLVYRAQKNGEKI